MSVPAWASEIWKKRKQPAVQTRIFSIILPYEYIIVSCGCTKARRRKKLDMFLSEKYFRVNMYRSASLPTSFPSPCFPLPMIQLISPRFHAKTLHIGHGEECLFC